MDKIKSYESLVQELQDRKIGYLSFVRSQVDIYENYKRYCTTFSLKENDTTARTFLEAEEQKIMELV